MHTRRVVLISDCTDLAFAEMRGAMLTHAAGAPVQLEPVVPVAHFSVINAAFALRMMAEAYPADSLLCLIMNSIETITERLIGRTQIRGITFEGTNTGAFGWLVDDFGCAELYELTNPGFRPFGGKYVHAPAVGKWAAGAEPGTLGKPFPVEKLRRVERPDGLIVHVDNFGNIKFPWRLRDVRFGDKFEADIAGHRISVVYWKRMMERAAGEWVVYPGSSLDLMEIGEVRGPGVHRFGVKPGDRVVLQRIEPR